MGLDAILVGEKQPYNFRQQDFLCEDRRPCITVQPNRERSPVGFSTQPSILQCDANGFFYPSPFLIKNLLFANDVVFYVQAVHPIDAEPLLQPFIDKVYRWGRK